MESCGIIKDRNERMVVGEDKKLRILKNYLYDLYNMDRKEQADVHISDFDGVQRVIILLRTEVEVSGNACKWRA